MPAPIKWTLEMDALLGIVSDYELAEELGISRTPIRKRRRKLGIPAFFNNALIVWTPEMDALLGTKSSADLAASWEIHPGSVRSRRRKLGIPAFGNNAGYKWTLKIDALLGTMIDRDVADTLGIHKGVIRRRRQKLGIPSWRDQLPKGKRRLRVKALPNTLTWDEWDSACEYFEDSCAYCGAPAFLTMDHLVPVTQGGPKTARNIIPACASCNSSKHNRQAHRWIYEKFGLEEGQTIVDRIVEYLTEVQS